MNAEIIKAEDYGIEDVKAKELTVGLKVVKQERELLIKEFEEVAKLELNMQNIPKFKELRLRIARNRTQGINKWHKANKEFFLTGGRFVDAIKNKENAINEQMEEKLMNAEKHFENLEKERVAKLQKDRVIELSEFVEDANERDLSGMEEDVWNAYLSTKKKEHEERIAAEKRAEEERIAKEKAEAEERKRIAAENEKLKKEAEQKAKKDEAERKRLEKEKRDLTEKLRLSAIDFLFKNGFENTHGGMQSKRYHHFIGANHYSEFDSEKEFELFKKDVISSNEKAELKAKEDADRKIREEKERKERAEFEARLKAEREAKEKIEREEKAKREKLEAELKAKEDAELKAKKEEEERLQEELNKGDAAKIKDLIADIDSLKTKYSFKSKNNQHKYKQVGMLLDKVINHIEK